MLQVLIIARSEKNTIKIGKKINDIYSDTMIISTTTVDEAVEMIKSLKPDVVVVSLNAKDSKNRNLLERLVQWEFEIIIFQDDELYFIQNGKVLKKEGYILKKIETE